MTALALRGYSLVRNGFIVALASWIVGHMTALNRAIAASRQIEANQYVARQLLHEYPDHTYASLLAELNAKTMKDIYLND